MRLTGVVLPVLFTTALSALNHSIGTTSGIITGSYTTWGGEFLGIKYGNAERFAPSKLVDTPGNHVLANALPPYCPQIGQSDIAEDCLFLNVYTPNSEASNVPVLVWVHGGSFQEGGSADPTFNGSLLAHEQNIVVVTLNYRLGSLGFYLDKVGDPAPAVTDVANALQWVHLNIAAFGGDTFSVTLAGESSGATLVRALSTSPSLTTSFSRVIIESDPQLGVEITAAQALNSSAYILEANNVSSTSELKQRTVPEILQAEQALPQIAQLWPDHTTFFNPWIDGHYVAGDFAKLASSNQIPHRHFLLGTVKNETAAALSPLAAAASAGQLPPNVAAEILGQALGNNPSEITGILSNPVLSPPVGNGSHSEVSEVLSLSVLTTKLEFECPTALNAKYLRESGNNVYLFRFDKGIRYAANAALPLCAELSEVCHQDDLNAVFGNEDPTNALGKFTRTAWADFARTGSPGWEALDAKNEELYSIGTTTYVAAGQNDQYCSALYDLKIYS